MNTVEESSKIKIHYLTDKEAEERRILEQKNAQKRKEATPNLSEEEREFCEKFFCVKYFTVSTFIMGGLYDNFLFHMACATAGVTKSREDGEKADYIYYVENEPYSHYPRTMIKFDDLLNNGDDFLTHATEYVNKLQTTQDIGWIEDFLSYNPCYEYYVIDDKINEKIKKMPIKDKYIFLRDSKLQISLQLNKKNILTYDQFASAYYAGAMCIEIKDSTTSYIQQIGFYYFLTKQESPEYLFEPNQNEELSIQKIMQHPHNYFFTFNKTEKIKEIFQEEVKIRQELLKRCNNRTNLCLKM